MVRVGGFLKSQNRIRRQRARGRFISPYQVGGTIFGKSTTARYPWMHTTRRINPEPWMIQQALRRMKGGTIFGKFTRRRNNPLGFPSASPEKEMLEHYLKQRMKGGTLLGKGDLRKVLWANQAKARKQKKQKGGNVFSKLKKRIQIDFPHRPFPAAHPIHDWYRVRKGIKRGLR